MSAIPSMPSRNLPEIRSHLSPAIAYYIRKLLHQNLDCLASVVAEGAGMRADSLSDLTLVIESLYLEASEISATIHELERLALLHQTLNQQGAKHRQQLEALEKQIFWLLGYRLNSNASPYRGTILVVDDVPNNLRLLTATLSKQGYEVSSAISGKLAIASIRDVLPDLILLDIMMPDMDGYEVCRQLKSMTLTRDVPVIFVSAIDNSIDKVKAFQVGAADYLTKPFQIEEVIARIDNQLKLRNLQQRLTEQNLRLEQEIREHKEIEAKYQSIFENAIDGIFQTTVDGKYISVNPALAQMYGYNSPAELLDNVTNIGTQLYVQSGRRDGINAYLQQHGQVKNAESEIYRQDGSRIWISEDVRAVKSRGGETMYYEGTVRDMTERRKMEDDLRQQRKAAEQLLLQAFPKTVAEQLKKQKPGLNAENLKGVVSRIKNVTVMVVDVANFAVLSRQIPPEEQVKILSQLFSSFDELVNYYKVEKIKSVRNIYMVASCIATDSTIMDSTATDSAATDSAVTDSAVADSTLIKNTPVENTVNTRSNLVAAIANLALDMQMLMSQMPFNLNQPLQLRIGISTGTIIAGVIGTQKFTYDIWGDTVELADQMRSHGAVGKIQVTPTTYNYLKKHYQLAAQTAIEITDFGSITPYHLLGKAIS